jgi:hypothetical protein
MTKTKTRQVIFFVLVFLLFYLASKTGQFLSKNYPNLNGDVSVLITGAVFTAVIAGIYFLAKMNQNVDGYKMFNLNYRHNRDIQ